MIALSLRFSIFLSATLCIGLNICTGLELTLDRTTKSSAGVRPICGVLTCEESHLPSADQDGSDRNSPKNVSSLSIYKNTQATPDGTDSNGRGKLVASLTLKQRRIIRVSDSIMVDGRLSNGEATLRLELTKMKDCRAQYTCEARSVDMQGTESVNSYRLRQQREKSPNQADKPAIPTAGSQEFLIFSQMLDAKLAWLINSSQDDTEAHKDEIESKLESRFKEVENKIESRFKEVENKIETRVVDKLFELDKKLSHIEETFGVEIKKDVEESFATLKTDLEAEKQDAIMKPCAISERFEDRLTNTSSTLSSVYKLLTEQQACVKRSDRDLDNLTEAISRETNSSQRVSNILEENFTVLNNVLQQNLDQVMSGINKSARGILASVSDLKSQTNITMVEKYKSVISDLLMPKVCRKGMSSVLTLKSFPYSVIRPSAESGLALAEPYLCDTVTDGGGWIIIQRRTTGTVDFYRDWATYKKGFGSLDDDFWLGNDNIHAITTSGTYELRVELKRKGKSAFAQYSSFSIDSENNNYLLRLGDYTGTAGDSLNHQRFRGFSTYDRDNDDYKDNCAVKYSGAWWYNMCLTSNLNGVWQAENDRGPSWVHFSYSDPVSFSEMKIRQVKHD